MNNLKDVQAKVLYLPLTGDGVFGKGIEDSLKKRKEQKEQLSDLIPEYDSSKSDTSHKRKFSGSSDRDGYYKKHRHDYSSNKNRSMVLTHHTNTQTTDQERLITTEIKETETDPAFGFPKRKK